MFSRCFQDVCRICRMFSGCSDRSYWPGGIWWSFQMKVWTLKIQRNPMIPTIRWSQQLLFDDPQLFDNQLEVWTLIIEKSTVVPPSLMALFSHKLFHIEQLQIMMFTLTGSTSQSQHSSSNLGISWRPTRWTIPSSWRLCPCCQVLPGFNSCMESCLAGNFYL